MEPNISDNQMRSSNIGNEILKQKRQDQSRNNFEINRIISFFMNLSHVTNITIYYDNVRNLARTGFYFNEAVKIIKCSLCNCTIDEVNIQGLMASKMNTSHFCNGVGSSTMSNNVPIQDENNYAYEESRVLTFLKFGWPLHKNREFRVGALELANSGFVCLCDEDAAKCFFCRLDIRGWEDGDTADSEHRKWNGNCPFLNGNKFMNNVPLYSNTNPSNYETDSHTLNGNPSTMFVNSNGSDLVIKAGTSKYEQYKLFETRLQSYTLWPSGLSQKPRELAEAGFFYTGKGDRVICYHCGGGLTNWSCNDKPWVEHATWFDRCEFLKLSKSPEFISSVKNSKLFSKSEVNATKTKTETDSATVQVYGEEKIRICKICFINDISVVYLPCGHFIACVECAPQTKNCEYCRAEKKAFVRAILPA